jgi:hypothetical protein
MPNDDPRWVPKGSEPDLMHPPNLGWDAKKSAYYKYGDLLSEGQMDWDKPVAIYPAIVMRNSSKIHCARSISRQRTTPWTAGIGPLSIMPAMARR